MNRATNTQIAAVLTGMLAFAWSVGALAGQEPSAQPTPRPKVFVALYERGPAWVEGKPVTQQPRVEEHVQYFLALDQKLVAAGPFHMLPNDTIAGIVAFEAASLEEAQRWFDRDPAVLEKVFTGKVRQWTVGRIRAF